MEPRGVVAHFEPGKGTMTIWSSTQNPHILRTFIAALTGLGQDQVRAIAPEVGGGFGAKINIYGEEYVAAAISKRLGIPVKWVEDRSEAFVATIHGRDILGYVDIAAKRDGTVLGLKLRLIADIGAYNMPQGFDDVEETSGMDIDAAAPQRAAEHQQIGDNGGRSVLHYARGATRAVARSSISAA